MTFTGSHFPPMSLKRTYTQIDEGTQRAIASDYQHGVRGHGIRAIASKYDIPESTVRHVVERARQHGGNPVTERGHKKRKLSPAAEGKLLQALKATPSASNTDLARAVGNVIKPRTVSDILARQTPRITTKVPIDQEFRELTDEWKTEALQFVKEVKRITLRTRVYADECGIAENLAPKKVRAPRGQKVYRPKPRFGKKRTLHVFAKNDRVLHWELREANANDAEVKQVALRAMKKFSKGDILIWDRLGRSGRSENPVKQHYNPELALDAAKRGVKIKFLPPLGKYFNPVELLFNDLKEHYIRGKGPQLTRSKLLSVLSNYMQEVAPTKLPGFFRERANGREAEREGLLV